MNSEEASDAKLRVFFGWSRSSDMPQRYARAYYENALAVDPSVMFEEWATFLRAIPEAL